MKARTWHSSLFACLLLCFGMVVESAYSQVSLPLPAYITTVAGNGSTGYSGDGSLGISAAQSNPSGVALDIAGNIFIADQDNHSIRRVDVKTGIITTVAGNGTAGYSGDGGLATSAEINGPTSVAVDPAGNLYIADAGNQRIREVIASTGIISTVVGNGTAGYSGDGGLATSAEISKPSGVAVFGFGVIYIADQNNQRIRKVLTSTGVITTVAGNGTAGYSGDGGPATSAEINGPTGITLDPYGNLFFADSGNARVREVLASTGAVITVAGNGMAGFFGDGGLATNAEINEPIGVAVDAQQNLYFTDAGNARVREVAVSTGIITTVAGIDTAGYSGDGGLATNAEIAPLGLAADASGNLYIADGGNERIRVAGGSKPVTPAVASLAISKSATPAVASPMLGDQNCSPGVLSWVTNIPGVGGTYQVTVTYSNAIGGLGCGSPVFSRSVSWITAASDMQCSPQGIVPNGQTITCWQNYKVLPDTSYPRDGLLYVDFGSAGRLNGNVHQNNFQLLTVNINGQGRVSYSPAGTDCSSTSCSFNYGTQVTLTAAPSTGYTFSGWSSGACTGTGSCTVTVLGPQSVTATFVPAAPNFTVTVTNPSQTTPLSLGHSMTYDVNVLPTNGFTGIVVPSLSSLPQGVTASFSPSSVTTSGSSTLTLVSSYINPITEIGAFSVTVFGTSGSLVNSTSLPLTTQPLQYKGTCGVK